MPSAAALRLTIERSLERTFPAALTPVPRAVREVAATGVTAVDAQLEGGLPVGAISELIGPRSSGRTTLALAFAARCTAEGRACAWIDVNDAFDPESAAAGGVLLSQLLWVRCSDAAAPGKAARWTRLDQALRATDLLLQAGGFSCLVLDLGDTPREQAHRIPLATWFRYRQAAERTLCSLLVLGQAACAQSAAAVVLECRPARAITAGETALRGFRFELQRRRERFAPIVLAHQPGAPTGSHASGKPPASTWTADAAWDREKRA